MKNKKALDKFIESVEGLPKKGIRDFIKDLKDHVRVALKIEHKTVIQVYHSSS